MIFILLLSILLIFPSCSPDSSLGKERKTYIITVADDFESDHQYRKLKTVVTDQAALYNQFSTFENVEIRCYIAQNGKRYLSLSPEYRAEDEKNNPTEADSSNFDHFTFIPKEGEEKNWSIETVLEDVGKINAEKEDLIIFTYSGHSDNNGSFVTNYNRDSGKYDTTNKERVLEAFSSISGKKVFFLDTCFSGQFISESNFSTTDSFNSSQTKYLGEDYLNAIKNLSFKAIKNESKKDFWILSSAGSNQEAYDTGFGNEPNVKHYGALTYYLLLSLGYDMERNEARTVKTPLTFYSIYSYIWQNFPEKENQTPRVERKKLDIRIR